jgi:hypothetical protein
VRVARAVKYNRFNPNQPLSRRRNARSRRLASSLNNSSADQPWRCANSASSKSSLANSDGFARLLHQFFGAQQGGQMFRDAVERGMAFVPRAVFFGALDFFPVRPDLVHVLDLGPCRKRADGGGSSFSTIRRQTFSKSNAPRSRASWQWKTTCNSKSPSSSAISWSSLRLDGVNQFIDLLDGVAAQRHVRLLAVPRTARRRAQPGHDFEQIVDGGLFFILENIQQPTFNGQIQGKTRLTSTSSNLGIES